MRRIVFFTLLFPLLVLLSHCEENPVDLAGNGMVTVTDTLYADSDSTFRRDSLVINTSLSTRLLIGARRDFECRPAFRFANLPDTASVINAFIQMQTVRTSAEGIGFDLPVTLHPINEVWNTDIDSVWGEGDEYRNNVDFTRTLAQTSIPFDTSGGNDVFNVELNTTGVDLVNDWIRFNQDTLQGSQDTGFFLDYDASSFAPGNTTLMEIRARQTGFTDGPSLVLQYVNTEDSTVIDTFLAVSDVFFIEGEFQPVADRLHTTTLRPWATTLDFSYDGLIAKYGQRFAVSSATLEMTIDWDNSYITPDLAPNLHIYPYSDTTGSIVINSAYLLSLSADVLMTSFSSDSAFVQVSSGGERQELARIYVQEKINNPDIMTGFHIDNVQKNSSITYFSFFPIDAADPAQRPRLIVRSLILPEDLL